MFHIRTFILEHTHIAPLTACHTSSQSAYLFNHIAMPAIASYPTMGLPPVNTTAPRWNCTKFPVLNNTRPRECIKPVAALLRRGPEGTEGEADIPDLLPWGGPFNWLSREQYIIVAVCVGLIFSVLLALIIRWLDRTVAVFDSRRRYSRHGESSFVGWAWFCLIRPVLAFLSSLWDKLKSRSRDSYSLTTA